MQVWLIVCLFDLVSRFVCFVFVLSVVDLRCLCLLLDGCFPLLEFWLFVKLIYILVWFNVWFCFVLIVLLQLCCWDGALWVSVWLL